MIEAGGKSYADLLKTLKQEVDVGKLKVAVTRMKKTTNGKLQLRVDEGNGTGSIQSRTILFITDEMTREAEI